MPEPLVVTLLIVYGGFMGITSMFLSKTRPFRAWRWYELILSFIFSYIAIIFWMVRSELLTNKRH